MISFTIGYQYPKQIELFQKEVNMRKRLIPIYSVLVVAIVLLAALAPSCTTTSTTGTITVKATLCGQPWPGSVNYALTGSTTINGTTVPTTHSGVATGSWSCAYVSGGPSKAFLVAPPSPQTVSAGGTITFTLNFEKNQDAAIQWLTWTINGLPWESSSTEELGPCNITDVHFLQWVDGCPGYNVTLNETDWLTIIASGLNPAPVQIFVVNATCALNKTPEPSEKVFQVPSINETPVKVLYTNTTLMPGALTTLDVETQWQLVKDLNYTKSINWLGISKAPFVPPGPHPCVLFELVAPPGAYSFQLFASAHVDLVDDTDVNPLNNNATSLFPLTLNVFVPGP
jgi:hypothetical protein